MDDDNVTMIMVGDKEDEYEEIFQMEQ